MHLPNTAENGGDFLNVVDERESLVNEICRYLLPLVSDITDAKSALYIILNKYEITNRCTELAEIHEDRNEYLLKNFLVAKAVKGCTQRTLDFYRMSLIKIFSSIGKTVDDITADDIRYYMAVRQRRDKVSKVTIANEIRALSSFFTWSYAEEVIKKNPMAKVERIKQDKTKKEAFTEMEIEYLRLAARTEQQKAIIEILLSTGCRVTELVNIMISDIDDSRVLVHGKGSKDRYVYLNARAELALNVYLKTRNDQNPYLFPKQKTVTKRLRKGMKMEDYMRGWKNADNIVDGHMTTSSVEGITRKLAKRAGVEHANPHKFRRTCATFALRRGMPIEQVSKMLGHESVSTTQIYLDLAEDELVQAHKKYVV